MRNLRSSIAAAMLCAATTTAARAVVEYTVINLGTIQPGNYNQANGVNSSGQAVGYSSLNATNGPTTPFLYSSGTMSAIPTLGGNYGTAEAINNSGTVAGYSNSANGSNHAFLYTPGVAPIDVGVLASAGAKANSYAYGINSSGTLVGSSQVTSTGGFHVITYNTSTGMVDLGTLPGGSSATGYGINSSGNIVGKSDASYSYFRSFFYTPASGMVDIGTLGGSYSSARAINNSNAVVGSSETATDGFNYHAYLWTPTGGMTDIGTMGYSSSTANFIATNGDIVGYAGANTANAPFIRYTSGAMVNLNSLISPTAGVTLANATCVADSGDIVGYGTVNGSSVTSAFELVPISRLLGDANLDGHVDLNDLNIVLNNLGLTSSAWTDGNFDNAGTIDLNDLNDVLNNLGVSSTPSTALADAQAAIQGFATQVPEPCTLSLLCVGGCLLAQRRRRSGLLRC